MPGSVGTGLLLLNCITLLLMKSHWNGHFDVDSLKYVAVNYRFDYGDLRYGKYTCAVFLIFP
jgi:hypothetical protein